MSNPLNINIVRVQNMGTMQFTYGFVAKDNYACVVDCDFDTMEEFLECYPSQNALISYVLEKECMAGAAQNVNGEWVLESVSAINVVGYPGKPWNGQG